MYRAIDVKTEMRKLTSSKPVYAAAGAGLLASRTLRDLPTRLYRWGMDTRPVTSLPARATGYVHSAREKATDGYDTLADHGKHALNGREHRHGGAALNGTAKTRATSKSTSNKSTSK